MRKVISAVLIAALLSVSLSGYACKQVKPSDKVKIARVFVYVPISASAARDISAVLVREGKLTQAAKDALDAVLVKTVSAVAEISGDVQAGAFNFAEWDKSLNAIITEWEALQPVLAPNADPRFQEWITLAKFLIPQIKVLVQTLKAPVVLPALPIITREGESRKSVSPNGIAEISAISVNAAIKFVMTSRDNDEASLWLKFSQEVELFRQAQK